MSYDSAREKIMKRADDAGKRPPWTDHDGERGLQSSTCVDRRARLRRLCYRKQKRVALYETIRRRMRMTLGAVIVSSNDAATRMKAATKTRRRRIIVDGRQ